MNHYVVAGVRVALRASVWKDRQKPMHVFAKSYPSWST